MTPATPPSYGLLSFGAFYDCSNLAWTFSVETTASLTDPATALGAWSIEIDTDGIKSDNCNGFEYLATVNWSTAQSQYVGAVDQANGSCAALTATGTPTWTITANAVALNIPASMIGNSPSIIWNGIVQNRTQEQGGTGGDFVPDPSFVDGPIQGAAAESAPGRQPAGCGTTIASTQVVTGVDSRRAAAVLETSGFANVRDYGEGVVAFSGDASSATRALSSAGIDARVTPSRPFSFQAIPDSSGFNGTPNDTNYGSQWNLGMVNAAGAWSVTTGANVIVADVDSGVDFTQPDLPSPQLVPGIDESQSPPARIDYSSGNTDVNQSAAGHGTAVAGVIAAATNNGRDLASLGWHSSVMPVRVNLDSTQGDAQIAAGIEWAADITQHPTEPVKVINLSLGGPCPDSVVGNAIAFAQSKGILVVAAAGNNALAQGFDPTPSDGAYNNPPSYPASYAGVVAVGAVGSDGYRAVYSDTGSYVTVVAPGGNAKIPSPNIDDILLLRPGGGTTSESGTSFSSPEVAATAALMLSVNPGLTPAQITQIIASTATHLGPPGTNIEYGYGLLNAGAALSATPPPPLPAPPPFEMAFQASGGDLWSVGPSGYANWGLGIAPGTSPSVMRVGSGGYEIAFQASGGALWSVGAAGWTDWGVGVAGGTSPSMVRLSNGGYEIAFQGADSHLWTIGTAGWTRWPLGMAAGTSPSIVRLPNGGYEIAFQAAGGALWSVGTAGWTDWGVGMNPGTSASVEGLPNGGFEIAFQASGGALWSVGTAGWTDWGVGMNPGTSPSIARLTNGGFQIAFQASGGAMWSIGTQGWTDWGVGMAGSTSPSLAALPNAGYEIAFQGAGGNLWSIGTAGWTSWPLGMAPQTSPTDI